MERYRDDREDEDAEREEPREGAGEAFHHC
jgi:hypothetical protein